MSSKSYQAITIIIQFPLSPYHSIAARIILNLHDGSALDSDDLSDNGLRAPDGHCVRPWGGLAGIAGAGTGTGKPAAAVRKSI